MVLSTGATAQTAPAETELSLLPIPYPDMSGLEEAVTEQLNVAHQNLLSRKRQESASADDLGAAFGRLGRLLHAYELYDAAEACYRNTWALLPNDYRWPYYLGHVYQKKGRLADAAEVYRRSLALEGNNIAARVRLGEVLEAQNLPDEAEAELKKALEINRQIPAAYAVLGEIALARGEHGRAVELLTAVLEAVPDANRLHYPLAMAYRGLGEVEKAKSHLAPKRDGRRRSGNRISRLAPHARGTLLPM